MDKYTLDYQNIQSHAAERHSRPALVALICSCAGAGLFVAAVAAGNSGFFGRTKAAVTPVIVILAVGLVVSFGAVISAVASVRDEVHKQTLARWGFGLGLVLMALNGWGIIALIAFLLQ